MSFEHCEMDPDGGNVLQKIDCSPSASDVATL
jgi:hypothetical protein